MAHKYIHVEGYVKVEYDVEVEAACMCDWYPYPHHHTGFAKKIILRRFRDALPHPTREEVDRLREEAF